ncbi:MAG: hypothetical protein ACLSVD_12395 [Eggerthellaceae bacterium]
MLVSHDGQFSTLVDERWVFGSSRRKGGWAGRYSRALSDRKERFSCRFLRDPTC